MWVPRLTRARLKSEVADTPAGVVGLYGRSSPFAAIHTPGRHGKAHTRLSIRYPGDTRLVPVRFVRYSCNTGAILRRSSSKMEDDDALRLSRAACGHHHRYIPLATAMASKASKLVARDSSSHQVPLSALYHLFSAQYCRSFNALPCGILVPVTWGLGFYSWFSFLIDWSWRVFNFSHDSH